MLGKETILQKRAEKGESREATVFVSVWCVYGVVYVCVLIYMCVYVVCVVWCLVCGVCVVWCGVYVCMYVCGVCDMCGVVAQF